jgi:phage shock protein PspC (stress-responsive transcriptional regulator)
MTDTSHTDTSRPTSPAPAQVLRRSKDDRVGVGVAGGLGTFFGVDPIVFRVLFVALSFMGLAGVVLYLICYAVIPEQDAPNSTLDRAIAGLRRRRVPLWLAAIGALVIVWVCLLSWWSPVPFSAIVIIAVVVGMGLARARTSGDGRRAGEPSSWAPPDAGPGWAVPADDKDPTVSLSKQPRGVGARAGATPGNAALGESAVGESAVGGATPGNAALGESAVGESALPTARDQLRGWWGESRAAAKARGRRGWMTEAAAYTLLGSVWLILGLVSLGSPIPVQAFLWTGFGIILGCMLIGALLRRPRWRMIVGVAVITGLILIIGTYPVRIGDPTGQQTSAPTTVSGIQSTYRMLGGELLLDLSGVDFEDRTVTVHINHGAGHVRVTLPADVDLVLDATARYGQIVVPDRQAEGVRNGIQLTDLGPDGPGGGTLRLSIDVLAGQIEILRA